MVCSSNMEEIKLLLENNSEKESEEKKEEKSKDSHYFYFALHDNNQLNNPNQTDIKTTSLHSQMYFKKIPVPPPNLG